jgi:hypothetical protein
MLPELSIAQNIKPYLGQPLPGNTPVIFASGIISQPPVGAYSITISKTGDEIYFSRFDGTKNTTWFTKLIDTTWSVPEVASFGLQGYNTEASFTPYSDTLLFVSDKKDPNDTLTVRKRIWYVTRTQSGWSNPQIFPVPPSTRDRYSPTIALNGNLYFSEFGSLSDWSIYKSELVNGIYQTPVKLSNAINGFFLSAHCYISPDESFMLFDAQSSSGGNIYLSSRNSTGTWNTAIKLDPQINSTSNQYLAYLSPDQKYLFYAAQGDIYWCEWRNHNPVQVNDINNEMPSAILLEQNYPNPFNPSTRIRFEIWEADSPLLGEARGGLVKLKVYDILGNEISTLVDEEKEAGNYVVDFSASNELTSGVYFYQLQAGSFSQTKKLVLMR